MSNDSTYNLHVYKYAKAKLLNWQEKQNWNDDCFLILYLALNAKVRQVLKNFSSPGACIFFYAKAFDLNKNIWNKFYQNLLWKSKNIFNAELSLFFN